MHAPPIHILYTVQCTVVGVRQGKECGKCTYIVLYVLRVYVSSFLVLPQHLYLKRQCHSH